MSTKFSHPPHRVVAQLLVDRGLGLDNTYWQTLGPDDPDDKAHDWPVFWAGEPDRPDRVITVYGATPVQQGVVQVTGEIVQKWGITIRVRGDTDDEAFLKAEAMRHDLREGVLSEVVTISATQYLVQSFPQVMLVPAGRDQTSSSMRWLYNLNCLAVILPYPITG